MRLRVGVRGTGRPLLLLMGIGGNLDMWEPFEDALDGRAVTRPSPSTRPARASPTPTASRGGCAAWRAPSSGCSTRSATTRSTCSACRSAACSPSSSPTRRRSGSAGSCSPPPGPASAAYPARPASCSLWPRRGATASPTTSGAIAGRLYGGAARHDPDAVAARLARPASRPPDLGGYLAPAVRDHRLDQPAVAAPAATAHPRARRRRRPDRPARSTAASLAPAHPRRPPARRPRRRPPLPPRRPRRHRRPHRRVPLRDDRAVTLREGRLG